jgi:hypothetical protein
MGRAGEKGSEGASEYGRACGLCCAWPLAALAVVLLCVWGRFNVAMKEHEDAVEALKAEVCGCGFFWISHPCRLRSARTPPPSTHTHAHTHTPALPRFGMLAAQLASALAALLLRPFSCAGREGSRVRASLRVCSFAELRCPPSKRQATQPRRCRGWLRRRCHWWLQRWRRWRRRQWRRVQPGRHRRRRRLSRPDRVAAGQRGGWQQRCWGQLWRRR